MKSMIEVGIVPDVIDVAPNEVLQVSYPSGAVVNQGAELTPTQVKEQPTVKWNADPNSFYTLILTDPDAPSRADPKFREVRHWLVANIPGINVNAGETIVDYVGSGPPKDSGLHRYTFLVFKQNGKIAWDEPRVPNYSRKTRPSSSARAFAAKYNLGNPIAGNFYEAQWDEWVPILWSQYTEF